MRRFTNTEREIPTTQSGEGVYCLGIEPDLLTSKVNSAINSDASLTSTSAAMSASASGINGGLDFGLWEAASNTGITLDVYARSFDQDQCAFVVSAINDPERFRSFRDCICVEPPITAEIDGNAATVAMCNHGRLLLPAYRPTSDLAADGPIVYVDDNIVFVMLGRSDADGFAKIADGYAVLLIVTLLIGDYGGFGDDGVVGHFLLLPLIIRGAIGSYFATLIIIVHPKQNMSRFFYH